MIITVKQQQTLNRKLKMIEDTLTSIRDRKGAESWIVGRADQGQAMIESLRASLYQSSKKGDSL